RRAHPRARSIGRRGGGARRRRSCDELPMIERVGVVVPARDEEERLPACLAAIGKAAAQIAGLPLLVVVVLDRCRDRSRMVVDATPGVEALEIDAGNVGI